MKYTPFQRGLAKAALALIAILYGITIVCALIDSPFAKSCLMASLFCTIVVPAVIYAFLIITRQMQDRAGDSEKDEEDDEHSSPSHG